MQLFVSVPFLRVAVVCYAVGCKWAEVFFTRKRSTRLRLNRSKKQS